MKKQERIRIPEIKVDELLSTIDNIRWENGFEFLYNGTHFLLFLLTPAEHEQNESNEDAEYFESTGKDGWDIYILETLSAEKKRKKLFHEIAECNLRDQEFSNSEAHKIALEEEQKIFGQRQK